MIKVTQFNDSTKRKSWKLKLNYPIVVGDSTARDGGKPGGKKSCELSHILGTSDTVPTDTALDLMSYVLL